MIRLAISADIEQIMPMVDEAKRFMHAMENFQWDNEYPYRQVFENDIAEQHLFVYEIENCIAAFVVLNRSQPIEYTELKWDTEPEAIVIHRLVVSATSRGKGLARKLLHFAETEALKHAICAIRTDTNGKNLPMLHLFETLNYRFVGNITLRNNPDFFCCFEKAI